MTTEEAILEELSFTDLDNLHLVRQLGIGISKLKPILREMEKDGKIKKVETGGEEKWRLV